MSVTVERLVAEIDADPARAIAALEAFGRATSDAAKDRTSHIDVDVDTSSVAKAKAEIDSLADSANGGSGAIGRLGSAVSGAGRDFNVFGSVLSSVKIGAFYSAVTALPGALSAAAGAVGGLVGALGPLSGLLAAIPTGLGAVVGGIGATVLGLTGIVKGVTATNTVMGAGSQTTTTYASRLRDLNAAERSLSEATRSHKRALQELADAKRALAKAPDEAAHKIEELHTAAAQAVLNEKGAILSLQQAQQNLSNIQNKAARAGFNLTKQTDEFTGKTYEVAQSSTDAADAALQQQQAQLQLQQAQLGVTEAKQRNTDAQKALNDAEKKGIKNSDIVRAAHNRVAEAQYSVASSADAIAAATDRIAEAQKRLKTGATTAQTAAYNTAMGNLSKTGQSFVKFLIGKFLPAWKKMRFAAQDNLLPGVQDGMKYMLKLFPMLSRHVGEFARIVGDAFDEFFKFWSQKKNAKELDDVLTGLSDLLGQMVNAAIPLSSIFTDIIDVATPMTTLITKGINKGLDGLADRLNSVKGQNTLARFFRTAYRFGKMWLDVLEPLGSVIGDVVTAAEPLARWILKSLSGWLEKIADWTGSITGQKSLARYFNDQKPGLKAFGKLLEAIAKVMFADHGGKNSAFVKTMDSLRTNLVPAIGRLMDTLNKSDFGPAFAKFLGHVADGLAAVLKHDGPLTLFVKALNHLADALGRISKMTGGKSTDALIAALAIYSGFKVAGKVPGVGSLAEGGFDYLKDAAKDKLGEKVLGKLHLTSTQDVFVTNWPRSLGGTGTGSSHENDSRNSNDPRHRSRTRGQRIRDGASKAAGVLGAIYGAAQIIDPDLNKHIAEHVPKSIRKPAAAALGSRTASLGSTGAAIGMFAGPPGAFLGGVAGGAAGGALDIFHSGDPLKNAIAEGKDALKTGDVDAMTKALTDLKAVQDKLAHGGISQNFARFVGFVTGGAGDMKDTENDLTKAINDHGFAAKRDAALTKDAAKERADAETAANNKIDANVQANMRSFVMAKTNMKVAQHQVKLAQDEVERAEEEYGKKSPQYREAVQRYTDAVQSQKDAVHGYRVALGRVKTFLDDWKPTTIPVKINLDLPKSQQLTALNNAAHNVSLLSQHTISGARALGGPVKKGKSYIVGERRAELFTPSQSGYIHPSVPSSTASGITEDQMDRILNKVLDRMKPEQNIEVNTTNEVDPLHVAKQIAWSLG